MPVVGAATQTRPGLGGSREGPKPGLGRVRWGWEGRAHRDATRMSPAARPRRHNPPDYDAEDGQRTMSRPARKRTPAGGEHRSGQTHRHPIAPSPRHAGRFAKGGLVRGTEPRRLGWSTARPRRLATLLRTATLSMTSRAAASHHNAKRAVTTKLSRSRRSPMGR
jgi:hypothetical protein